MKKRVAEYYLGLDIGTNSVGWAVTNPNYKVLRFNGKSMWGTHLFESGNTAEERRAFRCARRRLERRKQRLKLLQSIFEEEIKKVDPDFFQRMKDSKFWEEDKIIQQKNTLFNDDNFDDQKYHKAYPTVYHLRADLIHKKEKFDIRLIYLAVHHIIKHRGHFLFEGHNFDQANDFEIVFQDVLNTLADYGIDLGIVNSSEVKNVLKDNTLRLLEKKKILKELFNATADDEKAVVDLLAGSKVSLAKVFKDLTLDDSEIPKISFSDGIDEVQDILSDILQDRMYMILKLKSLYDWGVLCNVLQEYQYLSDAKKAIYESHRKDLIQLKNLLKKNKKDKIFKKIFKENASDKSYSSYIGSGEKKQCSQKDFCGDVFKLIKDIPVVDEKEKELLFRIENGIAFSKQVTKDNGVIPYQIHLSELEEILNNTSKHYDFLLKKDENNLTNLEKIRSIFTFRIPYYVGPLNQHSQYAWIEKKNNVKIYPWNFEQVVDLEKSADKFILRMTNNCTYLVGEDVLPKDSILYSKFNILNQLNNIRVDGEKLPVSVKQEMFNDKFLNVIKPQKVTIKKIKDYLKTKGLVDHTDVQVTGIDQEIVGNLKALVDFKEIMSHTGLTENDVDVIIQKIVILGESKKILKAYLKKEYKDVLSDEDISYILKLRYSGWGRLSRKFLTEVYHLEKETGELHSVINNLWNSQNNLMQLLSNDFGYLREIERINLENREAKTKIEYSMLDDLYVSPAVKRSIWHSLKICKEIVKIMGDEPKKIFIEMARGGEPDKKGQRTQSRKDRLCDLYKNAKVDQEVLWNELNQADEGELRDNRLFLYYAQLGRCLYSNEKINLEDLFTLYDIDHIYPQSKVKDDSIHNNMVLVRKELNFKKGDKYPIPEEVINPSAKTHWIVLLKKGLITKEKYNRLTRKSFFTEEELSGFIARQLVETRQSTKAIAGLLKELYQDSGIVYVKAENVSKFRQDNEIVKSRIVNDLHHAKDAYLNIVVGNVYFEKFTNNPKNFIKKDQKYSLNKIFEYPLIKNNQVIWQSENKESLNNVLKQVNKNNILFTRQAYTAKGGLFDQMPVKAGKGQLPLKSSDSKLCQIEKYGAYNSLSTAYFFLAEYKEKKKILRSILFVPTYLSNQINSIGDLENYVKNNLGLDLIRILIPKIKINSLMQINGFRVHITGRTKKELILKASVPLILNNNHYRYIKKVEKYIERNKKNKTIYPITEHQKITKEENLVIYLEILNKLKNSIYRKRLSSQIGVFEKGEKIFCELSVIEQCQLLYNAIKLFDSTAMTADLRLIGGVEYAGKMTMTRNLKIEDQIIFINQSITGLFEKKVDINDL